MRENLHYQTKTIREQAESHRKHQSCSKLELVRPVKDERSNLEAL